MLIPGEARLPPVQKYKFTTRAIEEIKTAPNAKFLSAPHERSVQKLIESRTIRK